MKIEFLNQLTEELELKKIPDFSIKKQILDFSKKSKSVIIKTLENGKREVVKS
jgi:hypothetical protein